MMKGWGSFIIPCIENREWLGMFLDKFVEGPLRELWVEIWWRSIDTIKSTEEAGK